MRILPVSLVVSLLCALSAPLASQAPASPPAPAAVPPTGFPGLDRYRASRVAVYSDDYGERARYRAANAALPPPAATENRVVFFGDSITDGWRLDQSFPGKPYVNRGIGGQTTSQMLVRFRQDVIDLKPAAVIIEAGTNDIASVMGPSTEGTMADFFQSMTELAKLHGIRVILASVTPVCDCFKKMTDRRPPGKIIGLNGWLKEYAQRSGSVYLDYYSALVEGRAMKRELTVDGLIPNDAGYEKMAPLAEKAIAEALAKQ